MQTVVNAKLLLSSSACTRRHFPEPSLHLSALHSLKDVPRMNFFQYLVHILFFISYLFFEKTKKPLKSSTMTTAESAKHNYITNYRPLVAVRSKTTFYCTIK